MAIQGNARIVHESHTLIEQPVEIEVHAVHESFGHRHYYEVHIVPVSFIDT